MTQVHPSFLRFQGHFNAELNTVGALRRRYEFKVSYLSVALSCLLVLVVLRGRKQAKTFKNTVLV